MGLETIKHSLKPQISDVDQMERLKLFLSATNEHKREDYFAESSFDSIFIIKDPIAVIFELPDLQNLGEPKALRLTST